MRGRSLTWTLRGVLAASFVVLVWTALALLTVRDDLTQARASLETARAAEDAQAALPALADAERDLDRAVRRLRQPGPALAGAVPLLGRSVRAVSRSS